MKILLISTEATPYFKTGGVADVVSGLAKELNAKLLDARIIVPYYRNLLTQPITLENIVSELEVPLGINSADLKQPGAYSRYANILKATDTPITYFVEQDFYFGRDNLYGYPDDYERFIFFCQATIRMLMSTAFREAEDNWFPEIIQGYDWETGLMPGLIREFSDLDKRFSSTRFVLNIHNIRRMGIFGSRALQLAQQFENGIYPDIGETDEQINFLGRGILFADKVVTVNPHFTINTHVRSDENYNPLPAPAIILKPVLDQRLSEADLIEIRNGVDADDYNPDADDPRIAKKFKRGATLDTDRIENKRELQRRLGLPQDDSIPLLGFVGKLIPGNGFEFLESIHSHKANLALLQLVVLADSAVPAYRTSLRLWENEQDNLDPWIKSRFQFDDSLARLIYAAADIYLLPVNESPSGINQYIAMRYGAVPLVYHTGSLCHSVENYVAGKSNAAEGAGIGFKFYEYTPAAFLDSLEFALSVYSDKSSWRTIQLFNMQQSFNWGKPASDYYIRYQEALAQPATPIVKGIQLQHNNDTRLLQALLEIDNLPGLGNRKPREILKQAARIIRGVLECDAVYVWDTEKRLGKNDLEPSLDYTSRTEAPDLLHVVTMLNKSEISVWGQLGDSELNGNCQPITDLNDFEIAIQQGWKSGKSVPIVAHGKLLGRIDIFLKEISDEKKDQWQAAALTALASSFGQRLSSILDAIELDQVANMSKELLDITSFDDTSNKIISWGKLLSGAQNGWLYFSENELKLLVGEEQESISKIANQSVSADRVISIGDWIQAPRKPDGHRLYRSLLSVPLITDDNNKPTGVIVLAHENPFAFSRHQEQLVINFLSQQATIALSTALWIKERDNIRLSQLETLSKSLVSTGNYIELLNKIVTGTMSVLRAQAASLYLLNNETGKLEIMAAAGYHRPLMRAKEKPAYNIGEGVTGWIAQEGKIFKADSIEELHLKYGKVWKGKFKKLQKNREPNAFLGIPLKVGSQTIGILKLEDREGSSSEIFSDEDVLLGSMMGNVIATVVYNYRVSDQTNVTKLNNFSDKIRSLSSVLAGSQDRQTLMDNIVEKIKDVLHVSAASLFLADEKRENLEIKAASGYQKVLMQAQDLPLPSYRWGEGVTGRIAETNEPILANSLEVLRQIGGADKGKYDEKYENKQPKAFYGMPLNVEGEKRPIGVLKVESLESRPFTNEDVLLITMMGNVIATVVHNANLGDKKLADFNENIRQLSSVLTGVQARETLMNNIVEKIKEVLHVSAASLFLSDEKRENLEIQAASGYQKVLMDVSPRPSYRWGEGVTGRIAENNKPILANSLEALREIGGTNKGKYDEKQENKQPKAFYGMPLNVEGEKRPIGVLKVESLEPRPFTDEDVLLITMMGNVIAAVVYNAQISEKKLADFNENIRQLSSVLAGSQDRQTLMDNIVEKIKEVLHVSAASLFLADEKRENLEIQAASGYQKVLMDVSPRPSYRWGNGVTGRIAQNNKPVLANSLPELRKIGGANKGKYDEKYENQQPQAFYGMPLNVEGEERPIGVLKVESLEPRPFTDEDVLLITMMGNVIAAVVYNAQIGEKKLADFSEYIRSLSDVLTPGGMSSQEWYQQIVDRISDLFRTDAASLYLIDEASASLVIAAASGYQKALIKAKASYELKEGVTGTIADTGLAIGANKLAELRKHGDPKRGKYDDLQGDNKPNSYYGVPLKVTDRSKPIGVLKFESLMEGFFTAENRLLIDMMANVIGTVINNIQQGEKRIGFILRDMGTLTNSLDVSTHVLAKYTGEKDSGLIDQLASALSEDLGKADSSAIDAEAEKIFIARKQLEPELRPELYERISVWARHLKYDRTEWQFNLYHSILSSNTKKYENWNQVRDAAEDWIALKDNVGQPPNFQKAASKIVAELAAKIKIAFSQGGMDGSSTWFQTILETKEMFGDEIQHILMLFQCNGDLDENNQKRLASLASQDEKHPYPVLLVVQWNTGVTNQQKEALRGLLAVTAKDVAFANIKDLLKLYETVEPDYDFRRLIKKQVSITSPFVTEGDVPDNLFFGRDDEIKTLATDVGHDYAVIGNRKIGKTSLLMKVERILISKAFVKPIIINCNPVVGHMDNFYNKFQEDSNIELTAFSPEGFDQAVRSFARQDGKRRPVFLIDEADRVLILDIENGGGLVKVCRGLSQDGVCTFIFFGSSTLAALRVDAKSDLFNFATSIHLGYLSKDISRRVLMVPLEKIDVSLENSDYITDKVFEISSGHPNLVQKIGSLLINYANDNNHRIIREHIDQICVSSSFRDYFLYIIWGDSGPLEKLITLIAPSLDFTYSEITTALKNSGIQLQSINEPSEPHQGVVITYNNVDNALKMLGDLSVLKEEASVYHFIPRSFQNMLKLKEPQKIKNEIDECLYKLSQKGDL